MANWSPIWNLPLTRAERVKRIALMRGTLPSERVPNWRPPAHYATELLRQARRDALAHEKALRERKEKKKGKVHRKFVATRGRSNFHQKEIDE